MRKKREVNAKSQFVRNCGLSVELCLPVCAGPGVAGWGPKPRRQQRAGENWMHLRKCGVSAARLGILLAEADQVLVAIAAYLCIWSELSQWQQLEWGCGPSCGRAEP
jgi:hypothetical protein